MTPAPSLSLLDTVALLDDAPEHGLSRGQVGTLVEGLAPDVWLVEFSDPDGQTDVLVDLRGDQMMGLRFSLSRAA